MMEEIIRKAKEYALSETKKYGSPKIEHFDLSYEKGQFLAMKFSADKDIVALGTILMDLKIGECIQEGKIQEHIKSSSDASKLFLEQFNLDKEVYDKIISCIDFHHGTDNYSCIEAEICANADCYRFLHPRGFFSGLILFGRRNESTDVSLSELEKKVNEKYKILSLDLCKQELEPYYHEFKNLILQSKSMGCIKLQKKIK